MEDCGQIISRLDELERRFSAKMDILADAMTRLAVQQQQTEDNSRRISKIEVDVDESFRLVREEKDRREEQIAEIRRFQETCPKARLEENRRQGKELVALGVLYLLVEAAKLLMAKGM